VKRYLTEGMRSVVNDAMDIQAGAAVCRGPRNILAAAYASVPVGITVEGANILTRTLIIYGQGAIRCHPFVQEEMRAIAARDLAAFDRAFFGHVGHVLGTAIRAKWLAWERGPAGAAPVGGAAGPLFVKLSRYYSAAFALISDAAMATLGGTLKRRERLSGRLADALAWMYLGSAALKRFVDDGQPARDLPFARWAAAHALYEIETALRGVLDNFPNRPAAWLLRLALFPPARGGAGRTIAWRGGRAEHAYGPGRARAFDRGHLPSAPEEEGLGRLEAAYRKIAAAAPVERKIKEAVRAKKVEDREGDALYDAGPARRRDHGSGALPSARGRGGTARRDPGRRLRRRRVPRPPPLAGPTSPASAAPAPSAVPEPPPRFPRSSPRPAASSRSIAARSRSDTIDAARSAATSGDQSISCSEPVPERRSNGARCSSQPLSSVLIGPAPAAAATRSSRPR